MARAVRGEKERAGKRKRSTQRAAIRYTAHGFRCVPVPLGEKAPKLADWQELRLGRDDLPEHFAGRCNVGVLLGEPSGWLVDVDLDSPVARRLAKSFLPATGAISGRKGSKRSHHWYVSEGAKTRKFSGPEGMVVELRSTGAQTIVPPSRHPSGERIVWHEDDDPAVVPADELERAVALLASASLLAGRWPKKGNRHQAALAVAGFLLRNGLDVAAAEMLVTVAARAAGDDEAEDRAAAVRDTAARIEAGEPATGGTTAKELVGERTVRLLSRWLRLGQAEAATVDGTRTPSQADLIVRLAENIELFHTPGHHGEAVAALEIDGHRENWRVRSTRFERYLSALCYESLGKAPSSSALRDAIATLEGRALFAGEEMEVSVRVAAGKDAIYIDLGDEQWRAVKITAGGWKVVSKPKVRFLRPRGMLALPKPMPGGDLGLLRDFLNLGSDDDWVLIQAWLVQALNPQGAYPLLLVNGEQGSAKSTLCRVLKLLVDPNESPLRTLSHSERDLAIAADNCWCLVFDNISGIRAYMADALCRLSTGGGLTTRLLYTDRDEAIFNARRPIVLNGIPELASRSDLLDRAICITLPAISPDNRRAERRFWQAFRRRQPRILGALLDALSTALRRLPGVQLTAMSRMADFEEFVTAAESALDASPGDFIRAYARNRMAGQTGALESSPIWSSMDTLLGRMRQKGKREWRGTADRLLRKLAGYAHEDAKRRRDWPTTPRGLSGELRRIEPILRGVGIKLRFERATDEGQTRRLVVIRVDPAARRPGRRREKKRRPPSS